MMGKKASVGPFALRIPGVAERIMISHSSLKERVAALEQQMVDMKVHQVNGAGDKPWLRTLGMFGDDPAMKEIFAEALKLRDKDRQRVRRRPTKRAASSRAKR